MWGISRAVSTTDEVCVLKLKVRDWQQWAREKGRQEAEAHLAEWCVGDRRTRKPPPVQPPVHKTNPQKSRSRLEQAALPNLPSSLKWWPSLFLSLYLSGNKSVSELYGHSSLGMCSSAMEGPPTIILAENFSDHNILQIHNNVMWEWQTECGEYFAEYF